MKSYKINYLLVLFGLISLISCEKEDFTLENELITTIGLNINTVNNIFNDYGY